MPPIEPAPTHQTLRLKSHKSTVLLHVDPLQTFAAIKADLLLALTETGLKSGEGKSIVLPEDPKTIQFGRPRDVNQPKLGFRLGEWEKRKGLGEDDDLLDEDIEDLGKGKGKGKAKGPGRSKKESHIADSVPACPKAAGLKDGAVLAFRFPGDGTGWDGQEEDEDVDMEDGEGGKVDMWGVWIASFSDGYGVENQGDVGGGREFEG